MTFIMPRLHSAPLRPQGKGMPYQGAGVSHVPSALSASTVQGAAAGRVVQLPGAGGGPRPGSEQILLCLQLPGEQKLTESASTYGTLGSRPATKVRTLSNKKIVSSSPYVSQS